MRGVASAYSAGELRTVLAVHAIAVDGMEQGLCVLDSDLRIVLFNRRFLENVNLPPDRIQIGAPVRDVFRQTENGEEKSSAASAEMWRDIERLLSCGKSFRMQRKSPDDGAITFHFKPTKGGGWVATSERTTDASDNRIEAEHQLLLQAVQHASNGICVFDANRNLIVCNDEYRRIYGYDEGLTRPGTTFRNILQDAFGRRIFPGSEQERLKAELDGLFRRERTTQQCRLSDGSVIEVRVLPLRTGGWLTEHEEITSQVRSEQALQDRNRLLDAALDHMAHGLCAYDAQFRLIVVNQRYLEIYGLKPEDAVPGTPMIELMRRSIARGVHAPGTDAEQMFIDLNERLIKNKEPVLTRRLADGRMIAVRHQPMAGGGWVGTYEDITERHKAEMNISHMARHDALTDLPNRLMFQEKMTEGLANVACRDGRMAVMCFDLDNFKAINDSLGHPFGDKLLKEVGTRLRAVVDKNDTLARLGGDEFAILHPTAGVHEARDLARRLVNATSAPFLIDGQEINSSICVGIAMAPENGTTSEELMKRADLALYRAKSVGRGSVDFFHPDMDLQVQARRAIEVDLRRAITSGEFDIHYQPELNLATNEIVGMEALVRWTHPERGPIPPSEFIPIAEETGLIAQLGEWVLRRACGEAAHWPASVRLAVNLSPVQFRNRALVSIITNALASARFPAQRLELEITEAVLLQKDQAILDMLHQLRMLGIRITMDDFGTGYSSLSYLRSFPFDRIKIDRSFVADIGISESATAIIQTIAALGSSMGVETTAEGIETPEQLSLVRIVGCTEAQGYLIGRPAPAAEARKFIQRAQRKVSAA